MTFEPLRRGSEGIRSDGRGSLASWVWILIVIAILIVVALVAMVARQRPVIDTSS
jgi:HAMP domain-containing protein